MAIGENLQAWRRDRKLSIQGLSKKTGLSAPDIEAVESGDIDPTLSMLEILAIGLGLPPAWLYGRPNNFRLLFSDIDEDTLEVPEGNGPDPVAERVLTGAQHERELYVLLTALLQSGEPKLLRAAEVNLRSLLKQARTATVPWQNRIPGHFEPPSD